MNETLPVINVLEDDDELVEANEENQQSFQAAFHEELLRQSSNKDILDQDISVFRRRVSNAAQVLPKHLAKTETPTISPDETLLIARGEHFNKFVESEKEYLHVLKVLQSVYLTPLQKTILLPAKQMADVFSNLQYIVQIHEEFAVAMEEIIKIAPSQQLLGPLIDEFSKYLQTYKQYCTGQAKSLDSLNEIRKSNKKFEKFYQKAWTHPNCRGADLQVLLRKPAQRILHYPTLVENLLTHTPKTHSDYETLLNCKTHISELVNNIIDAAHNEENERRILQLQESIEFHSNEKLVKPGRILLREANMTYLDKGKQTEVSLILMNDILIVVKSSKKGKNKLLSKSKLEATLIREKSDNAFELVCSEEGKIFDLYMPTAHEKRVLVAYMGKVIEENLEKAKEMHVKERQAQMYIIEEERKRVKAPQFVEPLSLPKPVFESVDPLTLPPPVLPVASQEHKKEASTLPPPVVFPEAKRDPRKPTISDEPNNAAAALAAALMKGKPQTESAREQNRPMSTIIHANRNEAKDGPMAKRPMSTIVLQTSKQTPHASSPPAQSSGPLSPRSLMVDPSTLPPPIIHAAPNPTTVESASSNVPAKKPNSRIISTPQQWRRSAADAPNQDANAAKSGAGSKHDAGAHNDAVQSSAGEPTPVPAAKANSATALRTSPAKEEVAARSSSFDENSGDDIETQAINKESQSDAPGQGASAEPPKGSLLQKSLESKSNNSSPASSPGPHRFAKPPQQVAPVEEGARSQVLDQYKNLTLQQFEENIPSDLKHGTGGVRISYGGNLAKGSDLSTSTKRDRRRRPGAKDP